MKVKELFDIDTGKDLVYNKLKHGKYPVVGHTISNNGIVRYTKYLEDYKLYDSGTIALAHIGNFYATIQPKSFYIGTRVKALTQKRKLSFKEKMYLMSSNRLVMNSALMS